MVRRLILTSENTQSILAEACAVLAAGGLVVYPTETMYGLGCVATDAVAVRRMLTVKERPAGKPVSVLVANQAMAGKVVVLNDAALAVMRRFLPGPVTVVCADKGVVDPRLTSEFKTLGIRISAHPFATALALMVGPITATSANPAGKARPYDPEKMLAQFSETQLREVDLFVDAGVLPKREPSTVIDTTATVQSVIRAGAQLVGLAAAFVTSSEEETQAHAKQMLDQFRHVLPEKTLIFALEGDMGMGKTQFAKGLAEALGVTGIVNSPTYTLIKEYQGEQTQFIHLDLWRASDATHQELELATYYVPQTVLAIEWPTPLLPHLANLEELAVVVRLHFSENEGIRTIEQVAL